MKSRNNIVKRTDSYKPTQWKQYPKGTNLVFSYFESRQTKTATTFFGLQYILKEYLEGKVVTKEKVEDAKKFFDAHFGREDAFNYEGWLKIVEKYDGKLPLKIRAVPEGTTVSGRNVLFTVENTDPEFYWLTNYMETLLAQVWYPTTIATNSRLIRELVLRYNKWTSDSDPNEIANFQVHDFGFRGVSSVETAGLGGAAHLLWFLGTDTLEAISLLQDVYSAEMAGFSIPASEHSTMTAWTPEGEIDAMENMLDTYPDGLIACVSDSFDIMRAVNEYWGEELKDKILNRDGRLVVRPDSGDPVISTLKIIEALWDKFGEHGTINSKGYKVLPPQIRMIQGDGIDLEMIEEILHMFKENEFSSENIAFGSGGGLLQKFNRDIFKFAFKCSLIEVNGEVRDVRKFPKEWNEDGEYVDSNKYSKEGRLDLFKNVAKTGNPYFTHDINEELPLNLPSQMRTVFENGELKNEETLDEIRKRTMFS